MLKVRSEKDTHCIGSDKHAGQNKPRSNQKGDIILIKVKLFCILRLSRYFPQGSYSRRCGQDGENSYIEFEEDPIDT